MSEPDSTTVPAEQIDHTTANLDRRLRRQRLPRRDRRVIVEEVRSDLQTAAAAGVSPAVLVGPDIDAFARATIEAGGYRRRSNDYPKLLTGGVLAAAVAVVVGYLLVVELLTPALSSWFTLDGHYPTAGPLVVYGAVALSGLLGILAAVNCLLRGRPAARETLRNAAFLVPIGAGAATAAVIAVARDPDYTTTWASITLQVLLLVLGVALALSVARYWAVRGATGSDDASNKSHALT